MWVAASLQNQDLSHSNSTERKPAFLTGTKIPAHALQTNFASAYIVYQDNANVQACMHNYRHTDIPTDVGTHIGACLPKYIPLYTLCLPHKHTELRHAHVYDIRGIERHRGIARWPPSGDYRKDTDDLRGEGDLR